MKARCQDAATNVKYPADLLLTLALWRLLAQGALAPLFASAALFGGYLLVKFFPNLSIEAFLNAYFWLIGSIAVAGAAGAPLRKAVRELQLIGSPASASCLRMAEVFLRANSRCT